MTSIEQSARASLRMVAADSARFGIIALIAFLTLVDLFAAQAILPSLVTKFGVSRATMGFAVNASTLGMAIAGVVVALFGRNIDRRNGIWISLAVLAMPTTLLSMTDDITVFTLLRVAQGLCMSAAFTLTIAYLAEHFSPAQATGALAAYVTGNVASNFFGRIMSAAVAESFGISANFLTFAAMNLAGAALVFADAEEDGAYDGNGRCHARNGGLARAFRRSRTAQRLRHRLPHPLRFHRHLHLCEFHPDGSAARSLAMSLGLVYFVFLPSMITTPLAGRLARNLGPSRGIALTLAAAIAGLATLLATSLPVVLAGMTLVAAGTFLAQAIATGHVGRTAKRDKAAASGIYLASYYLPAAWSAASCSAKFSTASAGRPASLS